MENSRAIPNTNGRYFITPTGQVFSNKRQRTKGGIIKMNCLRGYFRVCLCVSGIKICRSVHRLVAEAFIPNPENKPCINHKDGNRGNNNVENLEWCTQSENIQHKYNVLGYESNGRKLTKNQVFEILSNPTAKTKVFCEKFNVDRCCIESIRKNKTYKNHIREFKASNPPFEGLDDNK